MGALDERSRASRCDAGNSGAWIKAVIRTGWVAVAIVGFCGAPSELAAAPGAFEEVRFQGLATFAKLNVTDVAFLPSGELIVLDGSAGKIHVFGNNGEYRTSLGTKGRGVGQLTKPSSVAVDVDSRILVADGGASRVTVFDRNGDFILSFGSRGDARGEFRDPVAIESDHLGDIYVADGANSSVSRFARSGVLLDVIKLPSPPADIAVDLQLNVYVLMPALQQIQIWHMDGERVGAFLPKPQNVLERVTGFAVDGRGDVYLADRGRHRVLKFDHEGNRLVAFGSKGRGAGQFSSPERVVAGPNRRVAITDTGNDRAQLYEIRGADKPRVAAVPGAAVWRVERESDLVLSPGISDVEVDSSGTFIATNAAMGKLLINTNPAYSVGELGREPGQLRDPMGLAIAPNGQIIVADTGNDRLQFFDRNGYVRSFASRGRDPGHVDAPQDAIVGLQGYIYVADTGNNRIQIFNDQGILLTWFGSFGDEGAPGRFDSPTALQVDSQNRIYVLDSGNRRIQIFDDRGNYIDSVTGFQIPVDIALDEQDRLFVADQGCDCVHVYTADRRKLFSFGGVGAGPGQMHDPSSLLSMNSRVYVGSSESRAVKVFRISNEGALPEERLSYTHSYAVPEGAAEEQRAELRRQALQDAAAKIAGELNMPVERIVDDARIVSEHTVGKGTVEMTLTVSRHAAPPPMAPPSPRPAPPPP